MTSQKSKATMIILLRDPRYLCGASFAVCLPDHRKVTHITAMHVLLQVLLGVVCVSLTLILALLVKLYHARGYWKRRGVPTIPAATPLLGNFGELMLKRKAFPYIVQDLHNTTKKMGCKFAGIYMFTRPSLWLVDLDIIRDVTVRHFEHFTDRRPFTDKSADELLGRSLLSLQGDEWRDMRHTLSPAFTGAKLRGMVPLMESTCQQLADFLVHRNSEKHLDVHETMRRFAADVIASTAFGTVSDALHNDHDDFYNYGIKLMDVSGKRAFIFMGYLLSPWLMQKLGIPFVPHELSNFFSRTIHTSIKYRENELLSRPDMIQLLLDARQQQKAKISDVEIVAQAFTFFLGGFDTVAAALSFCVQLLAMHPDVQAKLRDEVDEAFERGHGQLGYELVHTLSYMDMVINEVMRMFPAAPMVDRMCTKSFELPEHGLHVEKGTPVGFSVYGLHHDPEYFPDPERFDPERFSEENKDNIKPFTFLPFGSGPRNCIGIRFAQLEVKLALAYIIAAVELEVCERTTIPLVISAESSQMKPAGGFWVTAKPRSNKPWVHAES